MKIGVLLSRVRVEEKLLFDALGEARRRLRQALTIREIVFDLERQGSAL